MTVHDKAFAALLSIALFLCCQLLGGRSATGGCFRSVIFQDDRVSSSTNHRNDTLPKIWVHLTLAVQYDDILMDHLARHYISVLGVDPAYILVELHHTDINAKSAVEETPARLQEEFAIKHFFSWYGNYTSDRKWKVRHEHRKQVNVSSCDWVVVADSDEFPAVPGNNLAEFLRFSAIHGYDSVFGKFNDRVAADGSFPRMSEYPSLSEQYPLSCKVTSKVAKGNTQKVVAFRGYHHENRAAHALMDPKDVDVVPADSSEWNGHCGYPVKLRMDHYKWHHEVILKLQRRYEIYREMPGTRQHEAQRVLKHIQDHGGKLEIEKT